MSKQSIQSHKNTYATLLVAFLWLHLGVAAGPVILFLKNGDRISGDLVSENDKTVTVKSTVAGKIKIPVSLIEKRGVPENPAAKPEVAAKAPAPAAKPVAPAAKPAAPPSKPDEKTPTTNIVEYPWYKPQWIAPLFTNWHVNLQIGSDMGFGTSDRQTFYGNATAQHKWDRVRNAATFSAAYGQVNKIQSANRMDGSIKTEVDVGTKRKVYAFNLAGAGYDEVRRLDLQFQESAGMGYKIFQKPKFNMNGELGAQYQGFYYANSPDRDVYSIRFGEDLTWVISQKLTIRQTLAFMPSVDDFTDFRVRYTMNFSYPLLKRTTLNMNIIDDYDSRPAFGVNNNDLTIQTTIGISF